MTPDPADGASGPSESGVRRASLTAAMSRLRFTVTRPVAVLMVFLAVMVFGGGIASWGRRAMKAVTMATPWTVMSAPTPADSPAVAMESFE